MTTDKDDAANGQPFDLFPEIDQPGLSELREAVARTGLDLPKRSNLRADVVASLNNAVASVPDGMASGLLAGVNPICGLYACTLGPFVGGLFSSTQLMVIATTSAAALAAGQALGTLEGEERDAALFAMVVMVGVFQVLFGVLRLGRLTRFVSFSVMSGFILGIALLTILSQLPTVTGYLPAAENRVAQTFELLTRLDSVHLPTLGVALLTLVLALTLPRTALGNFGNLAAIAVPSVLVALAGLGGIELVRDVGEIPRGVPRPVLPSFVAGFQIFTGALAVATITLVQGAGVSQSVPNPDGSPRRVSRDFIAHGAANAASGFFRGLPVGGSLSTTALSVLSGARSRWAAVLTGVWMLLIVTVFPGLVAFVAMPALAALLIVASAGTMKIRNFVSLWRTGWPSRLAAVTTFAATLYLPIQAAVLLGVVLSALLHLYESSGDVSVVSLEKRPDGRIEERPPGKRLASNEVTVLDVYGHLFYAGARTFEQLLPSPNGAENPVVILRLRGRTTVGATLIEVLANYADELQQAGGEAVPHGDRRARPRSAPPDRQAPPIWARASLRGHPDRGRSDGRGVRRRADLAGRAGRGGLQSGRCERATGRR